MSSNLELACVGLSPVALMQPQGYPDVLAFEVDALGTDITQVTASWPTLPEPGNWRMYCEPTPEQREECYNECPEDTLPYVDTVWKSEEAGPNLSVLWCELECNCYDRDECHPL